MKNSIKTFVCALALVATTFTSYAGEKETKKSTGFGTGIYTTKSGKINVLVEKLSDESSTRILLKNESGEVIYRETVAKSNQKFGRTLNVDELAAGKYEIEITSNGEKQTKSFELSTPKTERILAIR